MKKILLAITALATVFACTQKVEQPSGSATVEPEPELRTVFMRASQDGSVQKTSLAGSQVLWDAGDRIRVKSEAGSYVIDATVRTNSAGIGIIVGSSTPAKIRYASVRFLSNGVDRTSEVTAVPMDQDNRYLVGIYTTDHHYVYPAPGTEVTAEIHTSGGYFAPIVQSKSGYSTSSNVAVSLTDVEYSVDGGKTWTMITSASQLKVDFGSKTSGGVAMTFTAEPALDVPMTLSSAPGTTAGEFSGTTSSRFDPDETTLAVYPGDALISYAGGSLSLALPQQQRSGASDFDGAANIMVANDITLNKDGSWKGSFRNMCGILQLQLTGAGVQVQSIRISDRAGKSLWGTASVPAASCAASGISAEMLIGGSSSVTLDCGAEPLGSEPSVFSIVLPVGALSGGFDVTVTTSDGRTQSFGTSKATNVISRNGIKIMPAVALNKLSVPVINLHNDAVAQYMSYGKYSSFGSTSYFGTYASVLNKALCVDKDYPQGFSISWRATPEAGYFVTLTDDTAGRDVFTDRAVSGTSYEFINMVPGRSYSYSVSDGSSVILTGSFRTEGQVRMVKIDDSWNWRDLGGWTSSLGGTVQYEWLYRGGSLNGVWTGSAANTNTVGVAANYSFSANAAQQVRDLGIKAELDLRGRTGDGQAWSQESGIHSRSILETHLPIDAADYKQIMTDQGLQNPLDVYSVVEDVAWIIDQVVNRNHPVAFHCKSGADRTGAVGMIVLALLGVDSGDIARDYELTTLSHEKLILEGSSSFQTRRADQTSYDFFMRGFTTINSFTVNAGSGGSDKGGGSGKKDSVTYQLSGTQQQAYYYLNRKFASQNVTIPASQLDAFIVRMLGISSYTHPEWAVE